VKYGPESLIGITLIKSPADVSRQLDREKPLLRSPILKNCTALLAILLAALTGPAVQIPPLLRRSGPIALAKPPELLSVLQPSSDFRKVSGRRLETTTSRVVMDLFENCRNFPAEFTAIQPPVDSIQKRTIGRQAARWCLAL
jgi:hypothetical protein